jgi:hypothetical protein
LTEPCTIVIASPDLLRALKQRNATVNGLVLTFSDAEANLALEEILRRRPSAIELERQFAATPRGTALINRIKADPTLAQSEIRVVSHDSDSRRIVPRAAGAAPLTPTLAPPAPTPTPTLTMLEAPPVIVDIADIADVVHVVHVAPSAPLDQRGTRRAPRVRIAGDVSVLVDGNGAKLVDLSTVGAQVISPTTLKPNQRVRMALTDERGALRFNAAIAWAFFEIPQKGGPQYRAGVDFVDADSNAVGAFCLRHKP